MTTEKKLSVVGGMSIMALVGILVTIAINIFIDSQQTWNILNCLWVLVFCALIAYDMQKVKSIHQGSFDMDPIVVNKSEIIAALQIYLIRIFGREEN